MSEQRESLREQAAGDGGLDGRSSPILTRKAVSVNKEQQAKACPLCNESHDEILALLAEDKGIHRLLSDDLLAEEEWVARALAIQTTDKGLARDIQLATYRRHRLKVIRDELSRRRQAERYGAPGVPSRSSIPQELLDRIKQQCPIEEIALSLGLIGYGRRPTLTMHCPFPNHEDRHPSATIYCNTARWWCFVCNQGGDVIDLVMVDRGLSWREAVRWLADGAGIDLPTRRRASTTKGKVAVHVS